MQRSVQIVPVYSSSSTLPFSTAPCHGDSARLLRSLDGLHDVNARSSRSTFSTACLAAAAPCAAAYFSSRSRRQKSGGSTARRCRLEPGQKRFEAADAAAKEALRRRAVLSSAIGALLIGGSPAFAEEDDDLPARYRSSEELLALTDKDKERIERLFNDAMSVPTVEAEERAWSYILQEYPKVPEVIARAYSNRGNSRARQGKFTEAMEDYNQCIAAAPGEPDGYLNRGIVFEATSRPADALIDYDMALSIDSNDPAAWNNRGNALLALEQFEDARESFVEALAISRAQNFAFAAVNLNLAEFELGNDDVALKGFKGLVARWGDALPDARGAYALVLWDRGEIGFAEEQWDRAINADSRYRSLEWIKTYRRWPKRLTSVLQRFAATTSIKVKA
mmetsp:Transcript_2634/g.5795  ORF Transcript_2634/g.5795 Transcript_2634/m.5795 type:complete len:393 (+) Transcript_2634:67-1245(+)